MKYQTLQPKQTPFAHKVDLQLCGSPLSFPAGSAHEQLLDKTATECRRTSPNFAVNCHSPMELRPPTARKSHPNFFAHCKRSTEMIKYSKTIIPNVQNTMRTQVTPMVSNYGKGLTNRFFSISKHHVNAWFMHVWVKHLFCYKTHLFPMFKV